MAAILPRQRLFLALIVAVNLADFGLSAFGLASGLATERAPFSRVLWEHLGVAGLLLGKIISLAMLTLGCLALIRIEDSRRARCGVTAIAAAALGVGLFATLANMVGFVSLALTA